MAKDPNAPPAGLSYEFGPHLPENCPPNSAEPVFGPIFIGIPAPPIQDEHLRSYKEKGKILSQASECRGSAISVWTNDEAVDHAQKAIAHMRDWYIAKADLSYQDGKILATPSKAQPLHHSFWRDFRYDIKYKFRVYREPISGANSSTDCHV